MKCNHDAKWMPLVNFLISSAFPAKLPGAGIQLFGVNSNN